MNSDNSSMLGFSLSLFHSEIQKVPAYNVFRAATISPTVRVAYSRTVILPTPNDHTVTLPTAILVSRLHQIAILSFCLHPYLYLAYTYIPYCHFAYSHTSIRHLPSKKTWTFCVKPDGCKSNFSRLRYSGKENSVWPTAQSGPICPI